jgi:hypothetical protein
MLGNSNATPGNSFLNHPSVFGPFPQNSELLLEHQLIGSGHMPAAYLDLKKQKQMKNFKVTRN